MSKFDLAAARIGAFTVGMYNEMAQAIDDAAEGMSNKQVVNILREVIKDLEKNIS